jgi:hypothetical protein
MTLNTKTGSIYAQNLLRHRLSAWPCLAGRGGDEIGGGIASLCFLTRLPRDRAAAPKARDMLAPTYRWFTGGFWHIRPKRSETAALCARCVAYLRFQPLQLIGSNRPEAGANHTKGIFHCA